MKRVLSLATVVLIAPFLVGCGSSVSPKKGDAASLRQSKAGNTPLVDESKENADPAETPVDRYAVPEGGVDELLAYVEELNAFSPRTREDYMEHQEKYPEAIRTAAEKIMSLEKDESSPAYKTAKDLLLQSRVANIRNASPEEQKSIARDVISSLEGKADEGLGRADISMVSSVARTLEYAGQPELAAETCDAVAAILAKVDNPDLVKSAKRMEGTARRLRLPGNEMELKGTLLSGGELDWASYRGKVVLVDFWATWCGPCIGELPNVKEQYELYHERGFDVVGVSLDSTREALEKYLEKDPLPWVQLFDESSGGWDHPMATHYGVSGIPTAMLVDKEGKVISLRARGDELGKLLEQHLGAVAVAETPPPETATP
jgi:thiol-disulfide isomerase/thioredoxin